MSPEAHQGSTPGAGQTSSPPQDSTPWPTPEAALPPAPPAHTGTSAAQEPAAVEEAITTRSATTAEQAGGDNSQVLRVASASSPAKSSPTKRRLLLVWSAVVAAVALVAAVAWTQLQEGREDRSPAATASSERPIVEIAPGERSAAVEVSGTTLEGQPIALADFRGSVTVVNFWGSWCGPCRAEAPILAAMSMEYASRGVRFVGIDVQDQLGAAQAFERVYGITYPSFDDRTAQAQLAFRDVVPPRAIPSTLVLDVDGKVAAVNIGQVSEATLRALLEKVLTETKSQVSSESSRRGAGVVSRSPSGGAIR